MDRSEGFTLFICVGFFVCFLMFNVRESGSFQLLHYQTWGQGPLQFLCLLFVMTKVIHVSAASDFKLHILSLFLDLGIVGILAPGCEQEVPDFLHFAMPVSEVQRTQGRHLRLSPCSLGTIQEATEDLHNISWNVVFQG